jgi:outer membrane receptor protein involved in Fe transport
LLTAGLATLALTTTFPAFAQDRATRTVGAHESATRGVISGQVTDVTGAALPGVTIALRRPEDIASLRSTVTDGAGRYAFTNLESDTYVITAELSGFKAASHMSTIASGTAARASFVLEVGGLAESITVRGERTARSLRDTSASVAVYDSARIEALPGTTVTSDLLAAVPNVLVTSNSNLAPAVRGADGTGPAQGADAFFAGTRARLNFQIDGRPASYNEVTFGDAGLWDVQQVEVFRGPQSAMQGRNAVAGTVMLRTNDPSYTPEASAQIVAGNQDNRQVSGMVSGPIVAGQLAYRFTVDRQTSDSFVQFSPFDTGSRRIDNPGKFEDLTIRGKLRIDPAALTGFSTILSVSHARHTGPQTASVLAPYEEHEASFPKMPVFAPRTTGVVAETTWRPGGPVSFEDTLSITGLHVDRFSPPGEGNATIDAREITFEPRVRFGTSNGIRGFGGAYFFHANQDEAIDLFGGGAFDDRTRTAAAFGEVTVPVGAHVDLTFGGRLEREHRFRQGGAGPFVIDFDETYHVFSPKIDLSWHATPSTTVGTAVSRGYNGGGAGFTFDPPFVSYTFDPEFVVTSESYVRTDLGPVSFTGNVFYSAYRDMQLPFNISPDPAVWSFVVRNADQAVTYGAEAGARWVPTPSTELFLSLGLLRTDVTRDPDSGVEGHELPRSPAVSTTFGARYRSPRGFDASADVRSTGGYYSSITNEAAGRTDAYAVASAQVGYSRSHARVFLFANNIFDAQNAVLISPAAVAADNTADILRPRRVGIGLTISR